MVNVACRALSSPRSEKILAVPKCSDVSVASREAVSPHTPQGLRRGQKIRTAKSSFLAFPIALPRLDGEYIARAHLKPPLAAHGLRGQRPARATSLAVRLYQPPAILKVPLGATDPCGPAPPT